MAKNPAGWQEALDILAPAPSPVILGINARVADGHDPSWLWDVPFERLAGRRVVATGERALDLAVRLRYAGVEHEVHRGPPLEALQLLDAAPGVTGAGHVDVVGNYTVFADLLRQVPAS
jgi:UDP-N-acetylmuramyl tripeptide synthase